VARALRAAGEVPILMLTARASEADRLEGLRLGADDYVTKPFSPREIVLRVRAILRRAAGQDAAGATGGGRLLRAGELEIDLEGRVARLAGRELPLPPAELAVLAALARRPGRAFTRDELARAAFGDGWDAFSRTVDAHVSRLRRKLARAGDKRGRIVTVFGVGYKLAAGDAG
jgi:DNA-binding response OmpR family regulator